MIIIVQRSDLSGMYTDLEADSVGLQHFGMSVEITQKADLIVFSDCGKIYVLKAEKWPNTKSIYVHLRSAQIHHQPPSIEYASPKAKPPTLVFCT